jgi:hypothetical protein
MFSALLFHGCEVFLVWLHCTGTFTCTLHLAQNKTFLLSYFGVFCTGVACPYVMQMHVC